MKKEKSNKLTNLLLILASTALTLLIGEFGLRKILFSDTELFASHREASFYSNHIRNPLEDFYNDDYWKLLHLFNPSFSISDPDSLLHWAASFEKNTYRHHHMSYVGERRPVLLFGDSFAMCVDSTTCFEEILNADKRFNGQYYFLNYGVGGYGFDQIYLLMNEAVKHFVDPIVILSLLTTDLDRSMLTIRDAPKPYFVLDESSSDIKLHGVPAITATSDFIAENPPEITSYLYNRIKSIDWIARIGQKRKRRKYIEQNKALNGAIFEKAISRLNNLELDYFMLCFQPILYPDSDWRLQFIRKKSAEHAVPLLCQPDILNADQRETKYTAEKYEIPNNGHPTSYGNKIVADAIWKVIQLGEHDISSGVDAVNRSFLGSRSEQMDFLIHKIRSDAKWFSAVENKAAERQISTDSMLGIEAAYLIRQSANLLDDRDPELVRLVNKIRNNKKWLQQLSDKALKRNISLDSMIQLDAEYLIRAKNR